MRSPRVSKRAATVILDALGVSYPPLVDDRHADAVVDFSIEHNAASLALVGLIAETNQRKTRAVTKTAKAKAEVTATRDAELLEFMHQHASSPARTRMAAKKFGLTVKTVQNIMSKHKSK